MQALLLEDDESTRTLYGECITGAGHKVIECDTLESAYAALRTHRIDVLVLDLVIGDTNCLSLAQFAGYAAPDAEIILVTGSGRFAQGEVLSEYPGINWMLRKPIAIGDLEALIEHADRRSSKLN
ncbi:response regulator receiver domain-containing protein [Planktotalea frisia]|jgi:DNA-binding response OmpR family regulator|uniref:DNA-binding transcriptional activator KdpE n=1 Tax=Planktotalea frisia TaxID=696762 RepID=A0A1L9P0U0_9RHOB|nr:response regulator [Planktotalea frisia]OJI95101.1 DNA-binding transcriptional activator KdpE [Planktotalea frisia]PZX31642.1 response regulator receiver domain-containing protein [Planktotalea frisia]